MTKGLIKCTTIHRFVPGKMVRPVIQQRYVDYRWCQINSIAPPISAVRRQRSPGLRHLDEYNVRLFWVYTQDLAISLRSRRVEEFVFMGSVAGLGEVRSSHLVVVSEVGDCPIDCEPRNIYPRTSISSGQTITIVCPSLSLVHLQTTPPYSYNLTVRDCLPRCLSPHTPPLETRRPML